MIGAKVSTSRVRLRAGISVVDARANVTYVIPSPAISYILLKVEPSLDVLNKNPFVTETQIVLDSAALAVAKQAIDSIGTSDAVTGKIYGLGKFDSVSMADVVSTLLIFVRNFADNANVPDFVALDALKKLFDAVAANDDIQSQDFSKFIPDGVAMQDGADVTDGNQHHFEKGIMNMAFINDAKQIYVERSVSDSVVMAEAKAIDFSRTLLDAFGFTDTQSFITEMAKADTATVSESLANAFSKLISADSIAFFDQIVKNPGKGLSDSAVPDDVGSLLSQGYCDITYFLQDYVGESRTFT